MNEQPQEALMTVIEAPQRALTVSSAMQLDDILAQVKLIQDVMRRVMKEGEHYGTIPGCGDKKTLLQPGAQKIAMTFRLAPEYTIQETSLERGHKEYRVVCTLKTIGSGTFAGQGVGVCSTMESKYRFHGGARKCPQCGKEAIIKGKAEYGGGWLCFAKKGGCGFKWPDGAKEIEGQSVEKVEHDNPADSFNTVLKMAKKRGFVDAIITATAASDIFTQDIGDAENDGPQSPRSEYIPQEEQGAFENASQSGHNTPGTLQAPEPSQNTTQGTKAPATTPTVKVGPKYRLQTLNKLQAAPGGKNRAMFHQFLTVMGWILPTEEPENWPFHRIPTTPEAFLALGEDFQKFQRDLLEGRAVA